LEFLGRIDEQVKIRGYRIEPGEIEAALAAHPTVARTVVIAREDRPGNQQLVGYVVAAADNPADAGTLRQYLRERLPDYMVPAAIVLLEALPLTPNGKLDRKALPAPDFNSTRARLPRSFREALLARLFAEVLGLERVGIDDSFFELGGHSLLVTQLVGRIRATLGVEVAVRTVFEAHSAAQLAERLDGSTPSSFAAVMLPVHTRGTQPPLFCFHAGTGYSSFYARLMFYLGSGYPIYGLQARGLDGSEPLAQSIEEMVADYLEQIRRVQSSGPYHLIGYSFGGIVAHAMAALLRSQGEEVALVAVLDAYPADLRYARMPPTEREALLIFVEGDEDAPEPEADFDAYLSKVVDYLHTHKSAFSILDEKGFAQMIKVFQNNVGLFRNFTSPVLDGDLMLFRATAEKVIPAEVWTSHVRGNIEVHDVACRHQKMLSEEALTAVAQALSDKLSKLYPEHSAPAPARGRSRGQAGASGLKVIGAGLPRTGTQSLKVALERLLGGRCYHMSELLEHPEHLAFWRGAATEGAIDWADVFAGYVGAVDTPSCLFWPELMKVYPDALVVLSVREAQSWFESLHKTLFAPRGPARQASEPPQWRATMEVVARDRMPVGPLTSRSAALAWFERYNRNVRATVPPARLLVWRAGDGWAPLCAALNVPVPDEPFPHLNTRANWELQQGS